MQTGSLPTVSPKQIERWQMLEQQIVELEEHARQVREYMRRYCIPADAKKTA